MNLNLAPTVQSPPPAVEDDTIDLLAVFRTLWRGKLTILAFAFVAALAGGLYAYFLATPIYRATSVVMLDSRETSGLGLESVLGGLSADTSVVNTEVQVLRGRTLMGRVVDELSLTTDPEFNGDLVPPGPVARLKDSIKAMLLPAAAPEPLDEDSRIAAERDATVSALLDQVTITNVANSLVFQINVSSVSARKAARIADTIARLYIDDQLRIRFEAAETATSWLTGQLAGLKTDFDAAEQAVRDFRATTSLIDADMLAGMDRQLKETRRRLEQMAQQTAEMTTRLDAIVAAPDRIAKAAAAGDDLLRDLAAKADAGDDTAATRFDTALERTLVQLRQDLDRVQVQVASLKEAEQKLTSDIDVQSRDLVQLEQLTRDAEASRLLYEHFQTQLKEIAAQQGIQKADSRILSDAVIPNIPAAPRKSLILALSLVLGLIVGAGLVLLRETFADRIRSSRELEALTGHVVLAQIPRVPEKSRKNVLGYLAKNPTSATAEAIRNLRTSILLSSVDKVPKVIMVTSSVPGEGKTTTTMALAQNMTAMGRKVLIVEGDVRLPRLKEYVGEETLKGPGIAEAISGAATLAEAVRHLPGIADVLPSSKITVNAADLFSSARFGALMAEARATYDMVLIDTPPVLVVPDARVIAQQADIVVFAVHWDRTSRHQITEALHQLALVNIHIAGLALTQIDPNGMRRYGYGDSYGAYARYGKDYYTSA